MAITPFIVTLAALGGAGSFTTVRQAAEPWFNERAWIVPIGLDAGILALLAWDLLAEYVGLPWPALRWTAWAFIGGTVSVNVAAAGGDPVGTIVHAAMPVLFIVTIEGVRHLIRQWTGLATGARIQPIPRTRWLLAPISTALLWRRMVLWHITSYQDGLVAEHQHMLAVSQLQRQHGRWAWRWRAPLTDRLALRHPPTGFSDLAASRAVSFRTALEANDGQSGGDRDAAPALPEWITPGLLADAQEILAANDRGVRISKTEFGHRLREAGHAIANERLIALRTVAGNES